MNIALLAFDLDGTTIPQHQYLPQENRLALEDAAAQGILLVPASGRMKDFLPLEIISLPGVRYAITANGAAVYDLREDKPVYQRLIPNEKARQVQALLHAMPRGDDVDHLRPHAQTPAQLSRRRAKRGHAGYHLRFVAVRCNLPVEIEIRGIYGRIPQG